MAGATQSVDGLSTLDEREQALADLLKNGSRDDLERDAGILKEMGKVYCERGMLTKDLGMFVQSSALINAALLRTTSKTRTRNLKKQLKKTELAFFKVLSLTPEKTPLDFSAEIKCELSTIRKTVQGEVEKLLNEIRSNYSLDVCDSVRISTEKEFIEKTRLICAGSSSHMSVFFQDLVSKSITLLGTPPQEYAVLGLGSLARGDTTPFSDIEWAILVEVESKDTAYFRNLARLVHLFVLNIQETLLKSLAIKSLNDYDTKDGNWFIDCVAVRGFQFDSAAPYACNTPLGRPDRPTKKGRELIRTPKRMAQLCEYDTALKEGYNIDRIMTSTVMICGSGRAGELVRQFNLARSRVKHDPSVQKKAFFEILQLVDEFLPVLNFHKPTKTIRDIKKSMFRLPTLVVTLFKSCFPLNACTTWEILKEMASKNILPDKAAHNLMCVVSIAALLRLNTYLKKRCQDELISLLPQGQHSEGRESVTHFENLTILISRYYFTMHPLCHFICSVDFIDLMHGALVTIGSFYESSDHVRGVIELNSCRYEQARGYFVRYLVTKGLHLDTETNTNLKKFTYKDEIVMYDKTDEEVQESFNVISRTYHFEGKYNLALKYAKLALEMCSTSHCDRKKVPECCVLVACSYSDLHKHDEALKYFLAALSSKKVLHGDADCEEVLIALDNIAALHTVTGKFEKALQYSDASLNMAKKIYGDCDNPHVMLLLANRANIYTLMGDFGQALIYCKDAIEMSKRLHGNGVYPQMSGLFENVALVYFYSFATGLSLGYLLKQLEILKRFYPREHPKIAAVVEWIGITELFRRRLSDYDTCVTFMECIIVEGCMRSYTNVQYPSDPLDMEKTLTGYENVSTIIVADTLCFVGICLSFFGKAEQALRYQLRAIEMKQKFHNNSSQSIAVSLWNIGKIYCDMGEYTKSLAYQRESLEMHRSVNRCHSILNISICLNAIMRVHVAMEKWDTALKYGKQAIQKAEFAENNFYAAKYTMDIAIIYAKMRRQRKAMHKLKRALKLARMERGLCDNLIGKCLTNIGAVYIMMKWEELACQFLMYSLKVKRRLLGERDHLGIAMTLNNLGMARARLGQLDLAVTFHTDALNMRQRLHGDQSHPECLASRRRLNRVQCKIRNRGRSGTASVVR